MPYSFPSFYTPINDRLNQLNEDINELYEDINGLNEGINELRGSISDEVDVRILDSENDLFLET